MGADQVEYLILSSSHPKLNLLKFDVILILFIIISDML